MSLSGGPTIIFKFGKAYKWDRDRFGHLKLIKVESSELDRLTQELVDSKLGGENAQRRSRIVGTPEYRAKVGLLPEEEFGEEEEDSESAGKEFGDSSSSTPGDDSHV